MKLKKVDSLLFIDVGAPEPLILCDEHKLSLLYYYEKDANDNSVQKDLPSERNKNDTGVAVVSFKNVFIHKFGFPNDEALNAHPYYSLGLTSYSMFELHQSDWVDRIVKLVAVNGHRSLKHYIITFKDSTFECIAKDVAIDFMPFISMQEALIMTSRSLN